MPGHDRHQHVLDAPITQFVSTVVVSASAKAAVQVLFWLNDARACCGHFDSEFPRGRICHSLCLLKILGVLMGKPLPMELRRRVVDSVDEGHTHRSAAAQFRVSVKFVNDMVLLKRRTEFLEAKPQGNGGGHGK